MGLIHKLKTLLSLDIRTMLCFVEAYYYLSLVKIIIMSRPFSRIAPSLGVQMEETSTTMNEANRKALSRVYVAIRTMNNYTLWESECLVKAIAGMKMLERRRIESTLYLGTTKDDQQKLIAHAWLRSGSYYITGVENKDKFTVVGIFAKRMTDKE